MYKLLEKSITQASTGTGMYIEKCSPVKMVYQKLNIWNQIIAHD